MREPPRGQADLAVAAKPEAVRWRDYLILLRTPSYVFCTLGMAAMTSPSAASPSDALLPRNPPGARPILRP